MTNQTLMQERYGKTSAHGRRNATLLAAALLVLFFVWAIWVSFLSPAKAVPSVLGFEVVDSQLTTVRFSVNKPQDTVFVCAAEVLNQSFAVVGYREVVIGRDAAASEVFEVPVNTTSLGVTGLVEKCWLK